MLHEKLLEDLLRESKSLFANVEEAPPPASTYSSPEALTIERIGDSSLKESMRVQPTSPLIADLNVEVSIELGKVSMRVEDLLDLTPGQVVIHQVRKDQELIMYLGGSEVARGRLVHSEGKTGIEILNVVDSPSSKGS